MKQDEKHVLNVYMKSQQEIINQLQQTLLIKDTKIKLLEDQVALLNNINSELHEKLSSRSIRPSPTDVLQNKKRN